MVVVLVVPLAFVAVALLVPHLQVAPVVLLVTVMVVVPLFTVAPFAGVVVGVFGVAVLT